MNQKKYEFDAPILASTVGKGGAYVVFPYNIVEEFGSKRAKVHATFEGESYDGYIVNMGLKNEDGSVCYIIGVRKDIRKIIGKEIGELIHVTIQERE